MKLQRLLLKGRSSPLFCILKLQVVALHIVLINSTSDPALSSTAERDDIAESVQIQNRWPTAALFGQARLLLVPARLPPLQRCACQWPSRTARKQISIPLFSRRYNSFLTAFQIEPFHSSDPTFSFRSDLPNHHPRKDL